MTKKRSEALFTLADLVLPLQGSLIAGSGAAADNHSLPGCDLHGPIFLQILVHVKGLEQQVRLMAHALS